MAVNCWEYFNCGREPGGDKAGEQGVCSVFARDDLDGVNGGTAGGRACWAVPDTKCHASIRAKFVGCLDCPFFLDVQDEQGRFFERALT